MDYSQIEALCSESNTTIEHNISLKQYSSMKVGGECDILVKPGCETVLAKLLTVCRSSKIPFFVLGKGTNVLFSDNGFHGVVILIGNEMGGITVEGNEITALAGATVNMICKTALENSLSGAENLYGIPGTAGGALYMNAGAFGSEMKDIVVKCRFIDENGSINEMNAEDMELGYRTSVFCKRNFVITSVTMRFENGDKEKIRARMDEVMQRRREKQPLEYPSCGSTFKRPKNGFAAALIEECGLKGYSIGGAQVSEKHSGFVINKGGATSDDITKIVEYIKETVLKTKGVELECEMIIADEGMIL